MKEDRRFVDNENTLKPFLAKVKKLGKKTAKKTSLADTEWFKAVPQQWLSFTSVSSFKDNVLTIKVTNSTLRSEMEMIKKNIITNINNSQVIFVREINLKIG